MPITWTSETPIDWSQLSDIVWVDLSGNCRALLRTRHFHCLMTNSVAGLLHFLTSEYPTDCDDVALAGTSPDVEIS